MKPTRHITDDRLRWALDLVQDEEPRERDPVWYRNAEVLEDLVGMTASPPRKPRTRPPKDLPFTVESILESVGTGSIIDLELLERASPERNRLFAIAAIRILWTNESLLGRLARCDSCRHVVLKDKAAAKARWCNDRCRKRSQRGTDLEVRRFRPVPLKAPRFPGDT
ncbi:MAG: hypothetical protein ACRD21_15410 [Vicinamibacteria bacterium]